MNASPLIPDLDTFMKIFNDWVRMSPVERDRWARAWARTDLFFLLYAVLKRRDMADQWLLDRCNEVQASPNGHLDLWFREGYKSTIITFGKSVQDILASHGESPIISDEQTLGLFSHTRPIAKGFLRQIKREFELNEYMKALFPDICWQNPQKEAPKWSEDDGLIVKRKGNPKESTVEAWGLVDGQPTSKHFHVLVYDDVVTIDSVRNPEMIEKTTQAIELSYNLGAKDGVRRFIGTRYHFNDTYKTLIDRKTAIPRTHTATVDGTFEGEPVFLTREKLDEKRRDMGIYTFSSQMLLNPVADEAQGFKREWLKHFELSENSDYGDLNKYILVDPANEKKQRSDYSAFWVVGLGADGKYRALDMTRDRMNLTERANELFRLHKKWKPIGVGYEKYGMMADIHYIRDKQTRENYIFDITELGGSMPKRDRIRRLIPLFQQGKIYLPFSYYKTDYEGKTRDLVHTFIEEEYVSFPVSIHDDMLDALARLCDEALCAIWPMLEETEEDLKPARYGKTRWNKRKKRSGWAA